MAKKIPFPIKTETSCLLKWNWSTIWLARGKTNSCHRNWKVPFSLEEFDNFHNLPYKIGHRESMLRGEWPHSPDHLGCGYCRNIEEAGGRSDRQYMTEKIDQTPDELATDPTATRVTPAILEVFINNICNLGCTYCSVNESSLIASDAKKFNTPEFDRTYFGKSEHMSKELQAQYLEKLVSWLERYGKSLRRFHVLGGEPFFQKELDCLLEVWEDHPNPDLQFNVVSNMNVPFKMFKKNIDRIQSLVSRNKIERFDLTASLDCWGISQEYVRRGFKMDRFEENMLYALSCPGIRVNINSTHTLMSLDDYPALLAKKKEWELKTNKEIATYGMTVSSLHVDPRTFGGVFFKDTIKKIRKSHPVDTWDNKEAYKNINGILQTIEQSKPDMQMMKHFLTVYNELDRRHGTNWKETFPRIAEQLSKHIIL